MVSLSDLPSVAITMVLVAAIFVAGFLVVAGLDDSTTNTEAGQAAGNVTAGMLNIVEYAPVWGTIIGVAVLLGIVIGGFVYGRRKGMF